LGLEKNLASTFNSMAIIYKEHANFKLALEYYHNSLRINRKLGLDKSTARNLNNIGNLFRAQKFYEKAISYYREALFINTKQGYVSGVSLNHLNIGRSAFEMGALELAQEQLIKGLSAARSSKSEERIPYAQRLLAQVHISLGNLDMAMHYIEQALRNSNKSKNASQIAKNQVIRGEILFLQGNVTEAKLMAEEAFEFYDSKDDLEGKLLNVSLLLKTTDQAENAAQALKYALLKNKLHDSIYSVQNAQILSQLSAEQEFMETKIGLEKRASEESMEAERQKQNSMMLMIGLVFLDIFSVIIVQLFRKTSANNDNLAKLNKQIESHQAALQARNEQLMRVNDDKNDLVSIVAHDLRAPLGNIQGLVKHMQKDKAHSKDQVQYLEMIDRSCSRLIEMTNAVLDMEAIEAEHLNVTLQKLDVVRLVKNLVSEAKNTASEKQITLKSNLPDKDMNIIADQNFLQPVIQNLVTNAINYSPTHTSINLNVASNGFKTIIEVSDKGPGISASDQKRLFSPFQTLSNKPTQNENSTGLGLYITKRYVEAMNGLIRCNSKVGEGTTFEVEFESA
jgi:signal transduction histidine kinase